MAKIQRCEHVAWMQCTSENNKLCFQENFRLTSIIDSLPDPRHQYPSIVAFYGKRHMQNALREVFPRNKLRRSSDRSLLNLRVDVTSERQENPILFADGDLTNVESTYAHRTCHMSKTLPTCWDATKHDVGLLLHTRLAWLFVDVICIFAEDYGGLSGTIDLISKLVEFGSASSLPGEVRPSLIIATASWTRSPTLAMIERGAVHQMIEERTSGIESTFSSIKVLELADTTVSSLARYRRLKEVLLNDLDHARHIRVESRSLFSAKHLDSFWTSATQSIALDIRRTFNFILASRQDIRIPQELDYHLSTFVSSAWSYGCSTHDLSRFIASALALNAFPPGCHVFESQTVFDILYLEPLTKALESSLPNTTYTSRYVSDIQIIFGLLGARIRDGALTAAQLRSFQMKEANYVWCNIKTDKTCLFCLFAAPEHSMTCGHSICDSCLQIFGLELPQLEYHFTIQHCGLCDTETSVCSKLRPPTAGIRMLTVDGGGICGVIPLQFLSALQDFLGTDLQIQDLFDAAFGTSSGGLIVLGLFWQRWDVQKCTKIFTDLGQRLFASESKAPWRVLSKLGSAFWCLISDGRYDAGLLNTFLQDCFGHDLKLFGSAPSMLSGTKVGVTATTVSHASACLFANYNGAEQRTNECGYDLVQANESREPLAWEAARATSAAPVLFAPLHIPSIGTFQDGGLRHNNPIKIALNEVKHIWSKEVSPDFVLSLGTGKEAENLSDNLCPRSVFRDGFVSRLLRSLLYSLNGENPWRELMNHLDEASKASYVRLNIPFRLGESVRLYDTSKIEYLMHSVRTQKDLPEKCQYITFSLLVSTFYFELEEMPRFYGGSFEISGFLRCRFDARKVLQALQKCSATIEVVTEFASYGPLSEANICQTCFRFTQQMRFRVTSIKDIIDIQFTTPGGDSRRVSGSGNTVQWFVEQQQLDAVFGRQNHDAPGRRICSQCVNSPIDTPDGIALMNFAPTKRKISIEHPPRKKLRLH